MSTAPTSFFTLPAELRNQIYGLVWSRNDNIPSAAPERSPLAEALLLDTHRSGKAKSEPQYGAHMALLLVCRQIRTEADLLALSRTTFHLTGKSVLPDAFHSQISTLSTCQIKSIRKLTLTARVTHLRAMNEAWEGLPFGHPCLHLDRLVIVPQKPDTSGSCYAEVADLSQCHTLAYVLAETLKSLRRVTCVEVQNHGCFNGLVWRLLYRCLVYRMWRWGGIACGLKFAASDAGDDDSGKEWFKVMIGDEHEGHEVGAEVCRLMGKEGMDPGLFS
ncbi:hypothetical protein AMS68_006865 [Peltaster fructicola]|uniref:F-box domain-containing protein n=1 Tax=Peltaster fructicola TaxID=286661 RepID=A0A6H0Y3C8_9PEZI|nr:hypothetical protein AMS68_006865 [Peltaster fructicola]